MLRRRPALLPSSPATAVWLCQCLTVGALLSGALAYPSGAPDSQCDSMTPVHYGAVNKDPTTVYTLTASSSTYFPHQLLNVTIASVNGENFRGFLMQARHANNTDSNTTVGTFQSDSRTKLVCDDGGITHSSRLDASSITVTWKAPDTLQENIKFRATVVKVRDEVYPELYSDVVSQSAATTSTTTAITSTTTATTPSTSTVTTSEATTIMTPPSTTSGMSTSSAVTSPLSSSTTADLTSPLSSSVPPTSTTEAETNTDPVGGVGPERCNLLACLLLPLLPLLLHSLTL